MSNAITLDAAQAIIDNLTGLPRTHLNRLEIAEEMANILASSVSVVRASEVS